MAYNFASGPATLPPDVLKAARDAIADCRGTGLSILELPFTGTAFAGILAEAERDLRDLLGLSGDWRVLFLQGGASAQFALVPMNLLGGRRDADYVETGHWSRRAMAEAAKWCRVRTAARGNGRGVPPPEQWSLSADAAYCHVTTNETADGVQFHRLPDTGAVPLAADMSADLLTRPLKVSRFGLIYASAQKNLGVAGLTLVLVREDLLGRAHPGTPAVFDYGRQAAAQGKVNTPPTFAVLVAGLMLRWLKAGGGLPAAAERNARKAAALYAAIDGSGIYRCPVEPSARSLVNVRFHLPDEADEAAFLAEAEAAGLLNLKGHPAVGGVRATLCNAMPEAGVDALIAFMADFERRRG